MTMTSLGLDFGTTNTVATFAENGAARAFQFRHENEAFSAFRSVLCFWKELDDVVRSHRHEAGPWAIEQFLDLGGDCRFIQSFKTFAASPLFYDTGIFGKRYAFEDLLSTFLKAVEKHADQKFPKRVVIGRPVKFAGAQPDPELARKRYENALTAMGFDEIHHVYEPVAAAYFFAQRLAKEATILVADFGGGTSDFSVVRFSPGARGLNFEALGHSGVGIAGDAFDYRIVDHLISPMFGKGSYYTSWGKSLPIPDAYYSKFGKWNQLSIMKHTRDFTELQRLARFSLEPEKLEAFIQFLEADAGYALNRAITDLKIRLSGAERATLSMHAEGLNIERDVSRADFESWIAPDLAELDSAVGAALRDANVAEEVIDRVFLTGGTSFIPAVRELFERRFGAPKIETGDQLVSIAYGLALIAQEEDVSRWAA
ncbi:MAG: Hsp70 family protein [Caulobacterales bacterium]